MQRLLRAAAVCALTVPLLHGRCDIPISGPAEAPGKVCRGVSLRGTSFNQRQAACLLLALANEDRRGAGLPALVFDDVAARAGQAHTDAAARLGTGGHWDVDGRKPDQRYTEAGGRDVVAENFHHAWIEQKECPLDENPWFSRQELVDVHTAWMRSDAHRANILSTERTHLGIGISRASQDCRGATIVAAQELVTRHGVYGELPYVLAGAQDVELEGTLDDGARVVEISLAHEELPQPLAPSELANRGAYGTPEADVRLHPQDMSTDELQQSFRVTLQPGYAGPGLYYVRVWAILDGESGPVLVSQRTILVNGG